MKRRGAVMVLTLLVLTGLVAILVGAAATQRLAFKAGLNRMEERRTAIAADAACQYVAAALATQSKTAITPDDDWVTLGTSGDERFTYGNESFRIQVIDAASRINLNTATQAQLQKMNFTEEQVDSLLDWRSAGQTARANGAKDAYYNELPQPYNTALRPLKSVDELLLIKGFTATDLMKTLDQQDAVGGNNVATPVTTTSSDTGAPTPILYDLVTVDSVSQNIGANGQPKLDVNSAQTNMQALLQMGLPPNLAGAIIQRRATGRPFTSLGQILALPGVITRTATTILNGLTISANPRVTGKLDLNTVTADVLNTIPNITADQVQAIQTQQQTGFTSLGQLAAVPGITNRDLQNLADLFSVNTQTFIVRILAEAGGTKKAYEATISIEGTAPRVIRMTEAPDDSLTRWGWADTASADTPVTGGATS